jgi:hypothetical protein
MIRRFKFFHGCDPTLWIPDADDIEYYVRNPRENLTPIRAIWTPQQREDLREAHGLDVVEELTRVMSQEIARGIDEDIIRRVTRTINGGGNNDVGYLNHWLRIGDVRA